VSCGAIIKYNNERKTWGVFVDILLPLDECWIIHTWPSRHSYELPVPSSRLIRGFSYPWMAVKSWPLYKSLQILKSNTIFCEHEEMCNNKKDIKVSDVSEECPLDSVASCNTLPQSATKATPSPTLPSLPLSLPPSLPTYSLLPLSVERFAATFWGISFIAATLSVCTSIVSPFSMSWKKQEIHRERERGWKEEVAAVIYSWNAFNFDICDSVSSSASGRDSSWPVASFPLPHVLPSG